MKQNIISSTHQIKENQTTFKNEKEKISSNCPKSQKNLIYMMPYLQPKTNWPQKQKASSLHENKPLDHNNTPTPVPPTPTPAPTQRPRRLSTFEFDSIAKSKEGVKNQEAV